MTILHTSRLPVSAPAKTSALARIHAFAASLGPSEAAVAEVLVTRPADIPNMSTQELATTAGTSTATVVRACRSLGFRGFQHLRLELSSEHSNETASPSDVVSQSFESAREALLIGRNAVDREAVSAAALAITRADRVMFTANGFSAPPLNDAAMRFATIGRPVEAPLDILAQQFTAHTLGSQDVCLALTHSGANAHTLAACQAAKTRGATVITVCSFQHAPIPDLADIVLSAGVVGPHSSVDPFFVRLVHTVLMQALVAACSGDENQRGQADPFKMRGVVASALADSSHESELS